MGYYVPNKVKPICYNCPYRTNKYCGLLTEHDYLGDYPFNFEPYPYCPLIEVADRKTEPQPNADQHVQRVEYVGNDGRCRCWKCKHFEEMHETPIASDGRYYTYVVCTASRCHYEPKTEPQMERLCNNCKYYGGGEVCDHPSIGEVEMGGKGDTFPWIKETPKWCPLKDEPQIERSE